MFSVGIGVILNDPDPCPVLDRQIEPFFLTALEKLDFFLDFLTKHHELTWSFLEEILLSSGDDSVS